MTTMIRTKACALFDFYYFIIYIFIFIIFNLQFSFIISVPIENIVGEPLVDEDDFDQVIERDQQESHTKLFVADDIGFTESVPINVFSRLTTLYHQNAEVEGVYGPYSQIHFQHLAPFHEINSRNVQPFIGDVGCIEAYSVPALTHHHCSLSPRCGVSTDTTVKHSVWDRDIHVCIASPVSVPITLNNKFYEFRLLEGSHGLGQHFYISNTGNWLWVTVGSASRRNYNIIHRRTFSLIPTDTTMIAPKPYIDGNSVCIDHTLSSNMWDYMLRTLYYSNPNSADTGNWETKLPTRYPLFLRKRRTSKVGIYFRCIDPPSSTHRIVQERVHGKIIDVYIFSKFVCDKFYVDSTRYICKNAVDIGNACPGMYDTWVAATPKKSICAAITNFSFHPFGIVDELIAKIGTIVSGIIHSLLDFMIEDFEIVFEKLFLVFEKILLSLLRFLLNLVNRILVFISETLVCLDGNYYFFEILMVFLYFVIIYNVWAASIFVLLFIMAFGFQRQYDSIIHSIFDITC